MHKHILIPTDGSALATKAVAYGVDLAKDVGARVTFLTATTPFKALSLNLKQLKLTPKAYAESTKQAGQQILREATDIAKAAGVDFNAVLIEHEQPYAAILKTARLHKCDLIVMASHGRSAVAGLMLGSQAAKVLAESKVPVLVHR